MESRSLRWFLRIISGAVLVFLYVPLVVVVLYAFTKSSTATWPPQLFTLKWFSDGVAQPADPPVAQELDPRRHRRDGDRADARDPGVLRDGARTFLRSRHDLVRARVADRLSRDRDRLGVVLDGRRDARPEFRGLGDHRGARDVLRGGRVQQRGGASAPDLGLDHRGLDGPRCRRHHHVPLRDVPRDANRADRRGVARVRPLVR